VTNHLFDLIRSKIQNPADLFIETTSAEKITYAQLLSGTARYANVLITLGVEPDDRVAVQLEKSVEMLFIYLACIRAGAVFLPLNTAYTLNELDYFISDAEPALVVCDPAKLAALAPLAAKYDAAIESHAAGAGGSLFEKAKAASAEFQNIARGPDDLAAILYTSGTTGRSKGAMLSHDNLASNALTLSEIWKFTKNDVLIHALPVYHTHGLFVATNVTLMAGASMLFHAKFEAKAVLADFAKASVLMGVPTFYTRLLAEPGLNREAAKTMRLFISGSAPLLAETHREWSAKTGHAILERYGMTETNMNTSNPYSGERVPGAVGLPLPGVNIRIADPETRAILAQNDIGMIEVKGPNVFKGYWHMPEKTASEFKPDGYFITGDLGKIDESGYVHIVGRGKDLIISGGFNVYPKEVENEIDAIPGVYESAVIGVPHGDFGEGVVAVIVREAQSTITEAQIMAALDGRLAKFKLPKKLHIVTELPRNVMGKVQKNVLRDTYKGEFAR